MVETGVFEIQADHPGEFTQGRGAPSEAFATPALL
jgi:hypothetical protein